MSHAPVPFAEHHPVQPDYADVVARVRQLQNDTFDPALEAGAAAGLRPYQLAHNEYVEDVAEAATRAAERRDSGFQAGTYEVGTHAHFAMADNEVQSPLDLVRLGLPELPDELGDRTPLAVVIHSSVRPGAAHPKAIELITRTPNGAIESLYLENISAAAGQPDITAQKWTMPGEVLFSRRVVATTDSTTNTRGKKQLLDLASTEPVGEERPGTARIIRPAPTRLERGAAKESSGPAATERRAGVYKKLALRVGGALGLVGVGIASGLVPVDAPNPGKNKRVEAAAEMVLPARTAERNGVHQAEQYYDETTLARSRAAFDAYFKGDTEALKALAEQYGYQSNWMSPEQLDRVKQARTYEELAAAFKAAVTGLPMSFEALTDADALASLPDEYNHQIAQNFGASHKLVMSIISMLNSLDRDELQNSAPLQFSMVGDIHDPNDSIDPAGYFFRRNDGRPEPMRIVLSEKTASVQTVWHEYTHYRDLEKHKDGTVSWTIAALNPKGHGYKGEHNGAYVGSPLYVNGVRVTSRDYGNANAFEDTAVSGEGLMSGQPIAWDASTLTEKRSALIFEMERETPGFTAALLLRVQAEHPSHWQEAQDKFWYAVQQGKGEMGAALDVGGMALLLAAWMAFRRRRDLMEHGVLPQENNLATRMGGLVRKAMNDRR